MHHKLHCKTICYVDRQRTYIKTRHTFKIPTDKHKYIIVKTIWNSPKQSTNNLSIQATYRKSSQITFIYWVIMIYLFSYLYTLYAWQVISTTHSRRIIESISRIYSYLFLSFSYKVVLCQYSLFCCTPNIIFVYTYTKTSTHVLQFILR